VDGRNKSGHDTEKKKGEAKCLPKKNEQDASSIRTLSSAAPLGPLKERSMFLVLTVGALVKALVVTTVFSALKYSS
jgi:hypothetical protein